MSSDIYRGLPFVHLKLVKGLLDFGMNAPKIRSIHIATLKEIYQVTNKLGAEIVLRHMALNEWENLAKQRRAGTPTHDQRSQ